MTIIRPDKTKKESKSGLVIAVLLAVFLAGSLAGVFLYNQTVNYRHELKKADAALNKIETQNAEIKEELYRHIDMKEAKETAAKSALVFDSNPQYLKKEKLAER